MIYLSISISAAETKLPVEVLSLHWLRWNEATTSSTGQKNWNTTTNESFNFNGVTLADPQQLFLGVTLDSIIRANQVIVWSFTITNTESASLSSKLRSYSTSGFEEKVSFNTLKGLTYDITILSETREIIDENTNTVRFTITGKIPSAADGKNGLIWWMRDLTLADSAQYNRVVSQVNVFESIQAAADSGTTPEEMREVLSSWGEQELLPGIEDSVHAGVTSGMEEALENEKQEASSDGAGNAEQLQGAIDEALGDIEEVQKPFETLGSALSYNGQSATLTFPGMNVPFLGQISQPVSVNLTQKISEIMPVELLNIIRGVLSLALVVFPPLEVIRLFNKLLNKG